VKVHRKGVAFWRVARRYSRRHCGKHGSAGLLTPCASVEAVFPKAFWGAFSDALRMVASYSCGHSSRLHHCIARISTSTAIGFTGFPILPNFLGAPNQIWTNNFPKIAPADNFAKQGLQLMLHEERFW